MNFIGVDPQKLITVCVMNQNLKVWLMRPSPDQPDRSLSSSVSCPFKVVMRRLLALWLVELLDPWREGRLGQPRSCGSSPNRPRRPTASTPRSWLNSWLET